MTICGCRFGRWSWFTDSVYDVTTLKSYHDAMWVRWSWFKDNVDDVTTLKCYHDAMWVRVWAMELVDRQWERGDDTKKIM